MSTIVTRTGKGAPLTWAEADANFTNLNTDKIDSTELALNTGASLVGFVQDSVGAVNTTVQAKLREILSPVDGDLTITINVPAQYSTINAAFDFLAGKVIATGVIVTIQVADGTHILTSGPNLNHPQGNQIQLIGNEALPANCIITVAGVPTFDAFAVTNGYQLGVIAGFSFTLAAKAEMANNATAILATNGGKILDVRNCVVDNWYYSIAARDGGYLAVHDCVTSNAGDVSIWAFCGGIISGYNITVSSTYDSTNNLGYGYQAEYGGVLNIHDSTATTCYRGGFAVLSNGTGRYYNCTSSGNVGSGFVAQAGGVIEANGSTSTGNTRYGIEYFGAGTLTGLSSNSGNTLGSDNGALLIDQGSLGARFVSNGNMRIDTNGANSVYFHTSGGIQFSTTHQNNAVNYLKAQGAITGSGPSITAEGSNTNIEVNIRGKGTGSIFLGSQLTNYVRINPNASSGPTIAAEGSTNLDMSLRGKGTGSIFLGSHLTNYIRINAASSGSSPQVRAEGETDLDLILGGTGTGTVRFGTFTGGADTVSNGYITIKDFAGTVRKIMVTA